MKNQIIKIFLFTVIFFILDRSIAIIISNTIIESQYDKRLYKILENKIKPDCYVMGSSSAVHSVIASEIGKVVNEDCFNIGFQGTNIEMQLALLKIILKSDKKPKRIIYVANDSRDVTKINGIDFRYGPLNPYIKYKIVNKIICDRSEKNRLISYLSMTYRQNVNFMGALNFLLFNELSRDSQTLPIILDDGSMPLDSMLPGFINDRYIEKSKNHDRKKESGKLKQAYIDYIDLCKKNDIELIVIFPPNFFSPTIGWVERMKELGGNYPKYIDLSKGKWDKVYYYDDRHLNKLGAIKFSKIIGELINSESYN